MAGGHRYVVLGSGRQGVAAAHLLAGGAGDEVTLADADLAVAEAGVRRLEELGARATLRPSAADASDEGAVAELARGADAVLSAVPYRFNLGVTRACLAAGAGICDLGGNTAVVRSQLALHDEAERAGAAVVPDCGLAPGLANTLAAACLERLDSCETIRMYCGGLPRSPRPPLGYTMLFDLEGLFNEYSGRAVVLREGRRKEVPALEELEELELPGVGRVEAFTTSGGTSTAPWSFEGSLRTFEYKTVRYPGHRDALRRLALETLLSEGPLPAGGGPRRPRDLLREAVLPHVDHPGDEDLVVLRVLAEGRLEGARRGLVFDLLDRRDSETGFTAMERTTGFPAALVARLIAGGRVKPGAVPLERSVPAEPLIDGVRAAGLDLRETLEEA